MKVKIKNPLYNKFFSHIHKSMRGGAWFSKQVTCKSKQRGSFFMFALDRGITFNIIAKRK